MTILQQIASRETATGHAVFSPSQLKRIMLCPACVQEALKAPIPESSPHAIRGTKLHAVMEHLIPLYGVLTTDYQSDPKWYNLPEADRLAVTECIMFLQGIVVMNPPLHIHVEQRVSLREFGVTESDGTADVVLEYADFVHVIDWKFGGGFVSADNNPQMKAYTAGAMAMFKKSQGTWSIGQPARDNFTETSTPLQLSDAQEFCGSIRAAITDALSDDPTYHPGEACALFCPAKMTCQRRLQFAKDTAKSVFATVDEIETAKSVPKAISTATVQDWMGVLDQLRDLEAIAKDIRAFFHYRLKTGQVVPGKKLVHGRNTRKWKNEKGTVEFLTKIIGMDVKDLYAPGKIKSPAQVEKLKSALKKDDDFKVLVDTVPGRPQMVDEEDPRPAITSTDGFEAIDPAAADE